MKKTNKEVVVDTTEEIKEIKASRFEIEQQLNTLVGSLKVKDLSPEGKIALVHLKLALTKIKTEIEEFRKTTIDSINKPEKLDELKEAAEALKDGRVDGILIAGGLPTSSVLDAASSLKIRILSIEPAMIAKLKETMPWYYEITIPKGTYIGQTEDVKTVAVANLLICREDLSNELVYNMTKTLHDNQKDLVAAHSAAKDMKLQDALKGMTVPMHPGAEKYYKEKGIMK